MGLRIKTNISSQEVQRYLRESSKLTDDSLSKLASGKRITKASDDAAGLAISVNLEAQTRGLRQAHRNANDGISFVQVAEGGVAEISNILVRLRELSIQAASDTVGDDERLLIDNEYQTLVSEIDRIAQSTTFNSATLLNGESGKGIMDFQFGTFAGENNRIQFNSDATNATISSIGIAGTTLETKGDASDSVTNIDEALQRISAMRANLGAAQSRLQSSISNLETQILNQDSARSVIQDADMAMETSKLAMSNVLKSAGIATLVQANHIPNMAIRLVE